MSSIANRTASGSNCDALQNQLKKKTEISRFQFDEEDEQLPGRIAEIAKDAKSPMPMHELIKELNSKTKLFRTFNIMQSWLSDFRKKIPYLPDFDIDTKVKILFLFGAKVDAKYRKLIQRDAASVVFDNKKRIIKYKAKDGSFELNAESESATSTKQRLAKKSSGYSDTSETEEEDDEEDNEEENNDVQPEVKTRSGRVPKLPKPYTDNGSNFSSKHKKRAQQNQNQMDSTVQDDESDDLQNEPNQQKGKKSISNKLKAVKTKNSGRPKKSISTRRRNEEEDEEDDTVQKQNDPKNVKARNTKRRDVEAQDSLGEPNPQPVKKAKYSSLNRTEVPDDDEMGQESTEEQTPPVEETFEHERENPEENERMILGDADVGYDGYREEPEPLLEADPYQRERKEEVEQLRVSVYEYPEEPKRHQEENQYDPIVKPEEQEGEQEVYNDDPVEQLRQEETHVEVKREEGEDVVYEKNILPEAKPLRLYQNLLTAKRELAERENVVPNVGEMKPNRFHIFDGSSNSNMENIQPTEYVSTLPDPGPVRKTVSGRSFLQMIDNMVHSIDFQGTFKELQEKIVDKWGTVDHHIESDVIHSTVLFGFHAVINRSKPGEISKESMSLGCYLMLLRSNLIRLNLPEPDKIQEKIIESINNSSNQSKVVPISVVCSILENALMVIP